MYMFATVSMWLMLHTPAMAGDTQDCLQLYYMNSYQQAMPLCLRAAEAGYDQAQYVLAVMYVEGKGTKTNNKQAARWFKAASIQGHAPARYKLQNINLGQSDLSRQRFTSSLWTKQIGVNPIEQAKTFTQPETTKPQKYAGIEIFTKPTSIKNTPDVVSEHASDERISQQTNVLMMKETKQEQSDISLYRTESETPETPFLIKTELSKAHVKKSNRAVFQHYVQAARQASAQDQFMLGLMYHEGRGVRKNDVRAAYLFNQAANQGLGTAQLSLALMLYAGHGVKKDEALAIQWFKRAAAQGLADAQYSLGVIYTTSIAIKDEAKSVYWWKQAAAQQHAQAQHNLAVMYLKGIGVDENRAEAIRWFQEESKHGNPVAQFNLGQLYSEGKWLDKNGQLAANWFYRSGINHLALGQKDEAMQAANKIKQLSNQQHLDVPNSFLADVLSKQIQEGEEKP